MYTRVIRTVVLTKVDILHICVFHTQSKHLTKNEYVFFFLYLVLPCLFVYIILNHVHSFSHRIVFQCTLQYTTNNMCVLSVSLSVCLIVVNTFTIKMIPLLEVGTPIREITSVRQLCKVSK